ncbi:MAG TPA: LysM peptidoglycan-binding domain-containing protein, partial [Flavisolibacter sp.]
HDDDARGECFRKYNDPYESYRDHSDFLRYRPYYTDLFKLDPTDYEGWAYGLKKAGYATNPKYPQILIKLIRDYNLQDYTLIALGKKTQDDDLVWTSNEQKDESAGEAKLEVVVPVQQFEAKNYPSGVFHINETRVVFVEKGTSFLKLAENYNLGLSRLFEFNDMEPEDIAAHDMLLFLQRKRKTGQNEFHTVAAGETLHGIAQVEGIRLENLLAYNQLKPGMQPATGEKLYLHSVSPSMPRLANQNTTSRTGVDVKEEEKETVEADFIVHTVQPKETVFAIAKKYLVAIDDVMKWNSLQNADLKPGQQLRIIKR